MLHTVPTVPLIIEQVGKKYKEMVKLNHTCLGTDPKAVAIPV